MADFCKQCSIDMFGEDMRDLAGVGDCELTQEELDDGMGFNVLCEGCCNAFVDNDGKCRATNCLKRHGVK